MPQNPELSTGRVGHLRTFRFACFWLSGTGQSKWWLICIAHDTRNIPRACFTLLRATNKHTYELFSPQGNFYIRPQENTSNKEQV